MSTTHQIIRTYLPANDETPSAIENGANALAEGFLFTVAAALILGEAWRSSRSQSRRRGDVDDQLDDLGTKVAELTTRVDGLATQLEERSETESQRCALSPSSLLTSIDMSVC